MTTNITELCDLCFEMGNKDRMMIAWYLHNKHNENGFGVTELARKFGLTPPEVHRHLNRMVKVGVIRKIMSGQYVTTNTFNLVVGITKGIQFIQQNESFINEHNLLYLPQKFISRISEIAELESESNHEKFVEIGLSRIEEADRYIWLMSERLLYILASSVFMKALLKRAGEGLDIRLIIPNHNFNNQGLVVRIHNPIHVGLMVTDKSGGIAFPLQDGSANQNCLLNGSDESAVDWLSDLFLHYWNQAKSN